MTRWPTRPWSTRYRVMPSGCWEWISESEARYPLVQIDGVRDRAHRFAWRRVNGPIPDGMVVRHTCDNTICVNPDHLILGTQADNMRDMDERGRRGTWTPRTHCPQGHEYIEGNIMIDSAGHQRCLTCRRKQRRDADRRRRER